MNEDTAIIGMEDFPPMLASPWFALISAGAGGGLMMLSVAPPMLAIISGSVCAVVTGILMWLTRQRPLAFSLFWLATAMVGLGLVFSRPALAWLMDSFGSDTPVARFVLTGPGNVLGTLIPALMVAVAGRYAFGLTVREQWGGSLAFTRQALFWGLAAGLALAVLTLAAAGAAGANFTPEFDLPRMAANLFSNLEEEIVFRGMLLIIVLRAFGPTAAIIWTSVIFGIAHGLNEKGLFIALTSGVLAFAVIRAKSLWAGFVGHQVVDMIVDTLLP